MQTTMADMQVRMAETVARVLRQACRKWAPPRKIKTRDWANKYRYLSSIEAARPGKYVLDVTPYLAWENSPLDALDDPSVQVVVCQKSAQVAWTSGVLGNFLGKSIDTDPSPILVLFPKEGAAKEYMDEKFVPMVEATPALREKVDTRIRAQGQRQLFKKFPGGFLKLVGSNSPASVKSSPVPIVCVEEPDDCNLNLRGQGDSIKLAKERTKTYRRPKIVLGGTPTIAGVSTIAAEMELSDKRVGMVPCHECGEAHVLSFDYLSCDEDPTGNHPVFGKKLPETAHYTCPNCGAVWNDMQKNRNVRRGWWQATAPFHGTAGFYLNELYSPFPGSVFSELMKKWLTAQYEADNGDISPMIAFVNSSIGIPFEMTNDGVKEDELAERGEDYAENTVPRGGLILTMGVDVQHDRLAVIIRAWGRGEESWLVWWGEIHGNTVDVKSDVWRKLAEMIFQTAYKHETGAGMKIAAVSIDSSDGNTSDAVYHFVRGCRGVKAVNVMAVKGSTNPDKEIFSRARAIDLKHKNTKADKFGVQVYSVGVSRAKDLLIDEHARINLEGSGAGRMHFYSGVRADYCGQLLSEIKVPSRMNKHKKVWQKKVGVRNEALDCEVYALHAARSLGTHTMSATRWALYESALLQSELFSEPKAEADQVVGSETGHKNSSGYSAVNRRKRGSNFATNF